MFRWLKRFFQHDKNAVDFTKVEQHIEVQGPSPMPTTVSKFEPAEVTAYDKMLTRRDMDTYASTMVTLETIEDIEHKLAQYVRRLK